MRGHYLFHEITPYPFYKVHMGKKENASLREDYYIQGTPTIIHFKDGQEIAYYEGVQRIEELLLHQFKITL